MTRQQLLLVAVFVLIMVFNILAQLRQRRVARPREQPEQERPPAAPLPPQARPPAIERPAPRFRSRREPVPGPPAPEVARPGRGARPRVAARDLRSAIVLSAVLAPCHGVQRPGHVASDLPSDR